MPPGFLLEELGGLGPGATGLPRTRPRESPAERRRAAAAASVSRSAQWGCPATSPRATPSRTAASRARRARSPPRRRARCRWGGRPTGWAARAARGDRGSGPRACAGTGTWPRAPGDPFRAARVTPAPLPSRGSPGGPRSRPRSTRGWETEAPEPRTELVSGGRPRTQGPAAGRPRASDPAHGRENSEPFSPPLQPPHPARPTFPTEPSLGRLRPAPPLGGLLSSPRGPGELPGDSTRPLKFSNLCFWGLSISASSTPGGLAAHPRPPGSAWSRSLGALQ